MQRLAFIIVIPTVLVAGFLVVWGALRNETTFIATGTAMLSSYAGVAVAFYFPSQKPPTPPIPPVQTGT